MTVVAFLVPGEPVAKGRPRVTTVQGRARMFTPARTERAEDRVALFARNAMEGREMLYGALAAELGVVLPIPMSWSKRRQAAARSGEVRPAKRADCDNYAKLALDAMNGIVYRDDCLVVDLVVRKFYGERPGLSVCVRRIGEAP